MFASARRQHVLPRWATTCACKYKAPAATCVRQRARARCNHDLAQQHHNNKFTTACNMTLQVQMQEG
eukprot:13802644-Alexandrium_andersonii.AAC.1